MKISVIGCGYLGAVHAVCMAALGHDVIGIDVDQKKIDGLAAGRSPFFEPELDDLLDAVSQRLYFTTETAAASQATVHFIAVGTPQQNGSHSADLRYLDAAVDALLPHLGPGHLVVGKSTVPVGTAERLAERIEAVGARLIWNPEFLREGFAVQDTLHPDRLVYGVAADDDESVELLDRVYIRTLTSGTPRIVTDYATAQLVKVAANSFLATKISFINAMAEVCEATGADVTTLATAIGYDDRIGPKFLRAGIGFGGGCLPKDIRAFQARAEELGVDHALAFLTDVDEVNMRRRQRAVDLLFDRFGDLEDLTIGVLGLTFKPNSDDIRDSPALWIADRLSLAGARVQAYDPQGNENARAAVPHLTYCSSAVEAVTSVDAVFVLTEWAEFVELDPASVRQVTLGSIVVDGRNCLEAGRWQAAGFEYIGFGR